jgi:chromosome segregation ATPase
MQENGSQTLYSFSDAKTYQSDEIFGSKANVGVKNPEDKSISQPSHKEENVSEKLEELTLDQLLKLGVLKDHIAGLRKDDTDKIEELEGKIQELEDAAKEHGTELETKDSKIKELEDEVKEKQESLDKISDAEKQVDVEKLVDLYVKIEHPKVKEIIDEKDVEKQKELRQTFTDDVAKRDHDSIKESLTDLAATAEKNNISATVDNDVDSVNGKKPPAASPEKKTYGSILSKTLAGKSKN